MTRTHQRADDNSWTAWLRDKVLPPILIAAVLGGVGGGWVMYQKIVAVTDSLPKISTELAMVRESIPHINAELARMNDKQLRMESDLTVVRSQMVGWDVMKRIEMGVNAAAKDGKGNQAVGVISAILRSEIEARKEKP